MGKVFGMQKKKILKNRQIVKENLQTRAKKNCKKRSSKAFYLCLRKKQQAYAKNGKI